MMREPFLAGPPGDRYDGKPLVRLLELYVLWSLDALSDADAQTLEDMTPKLRQVYGATGEWHDVIAAALKLPAAMPADMRAMWARNVEIANARGEALTPQRFAEMIVDDNFAYVRH